MKIGLDYQRIWTNYSGGTTTFAMGLLDGISRVAGNVQIKLFVAKHNIDAFNKFRNLPNFEIIEVPSAGRQYLRLTDAIVRFSYRFKLKKIHKTVINKHWTRATKLKDNKCDLIYTPTDLTAYNNKVPTMVSLHDIQHAHFSEFFTVEQLRERAVTFSNCVNNLGYLQASSEFMKEDFLEHFKCLRSEMVIVIPEGVDIDAFRMHNSLSDVSEKYKLPELFLYYPGQLWPHKNHITLLKAILRLKDVYGITIPLVLTGAKYGAAENIFNFIEKNNMDYVKYLGVVPFDDVKALYKKAHFMVSSVLYESSSLPIREAAAAGTAIIASATPPNIEAAEILKINLFNPTDVEELSELIRSVWDDKIFRESQIEYNQKAVNHYSWDNVARQYIDTFKKILS